MLRRANQDRSQDGAGKRNKPRGNTGKRGREPDGVWLLFWNVAGVKEKDEEFWDFITSFDAVGLTETWLEEREWQSWEKKLPAGCIWTCQGAVREARKGRAKEGIITGVKREIAAEIEVERPPIEGAVRRGLAVNGEKWSMITVYNRGGERRKLKEIEEWVGEEREEGKMVIGGDFNARIGEEGSRGVDGEEDDLGSRRGARDKTINTEEEALLELAAKRGWTILNGNVSGDEEGAITYIKGAHRTTIDYAIANEDSWEQIAELQVKDRTDSDHQPLAVRIEGRGVEARKEDAKRKVQGWNEKDIETFRGRIEKVEWREVDPCPAWQKTAARINDATPTREIKGGWKTGKNDWWDTECREAKKQLRMQWKKTNKGEAGQEYEEYKKMRKGYSDKCEQKRREWRKEEERKLQQIRSETEAWNFINSRRKKKEGISDKISEEEWTNFFMTSLGGVGLRPDPGNEEEANPANGGDAVLEGIRIEEVVEQMGRLKKKKAAGGDGIKNEAWIYGGEILTRRLWEVCKGVWEGRGYPDDWRDGVISPIHKKGGRDEVKNYRGITLTSTAYKVYASIINKRLVADMERAGKFEDTQTGFRKGRGTVDNIYIINQVIQKRIARKRGKMFLVFIDLKAAFDKLDRQVLWTAMEEAGVSGSIIRSVKEIYRETRCKVKIGDKLSDSFWVDKGVRQGCPLSPTLFNIYIADLEETLRRGQDGGVVVGDRKIWSLGYADDIALMAESEEDMKAMIRRAERYFERKKLEVNTEKTKVMVCSKGGGKRSKPSWKWGGKELEETRTMDYLGYRLTRTGEQGEHVKERVRKARLAMGAIWSIGERNFRGDVRWRLKLFDAVVKSILMYGVEIWGWKEWGEVENLQDRYLRWILGVERTTPGYVVREEMKREKLRVCTGGRAVKYEERIEQETTKNLPAECKKETRRGERRNERTKWSMCREKYLNRCGASSAWMNEMNQRGAGTMELLMERDRDSQAQERWTKIRDSKSARRYKFIMTDELPEYTRKGRGNRDRGVRTVARLRCGNEERENKYWLDEFDRRCRICGRESETLEHLTTRCADELRWPDGIESLLDPNGRGKDWGMRLESAREEVRRRREAEWDRDD